MTRLQRMRPKNRSTLLLFDKLATSPNRQIL